MVGDADPLDLIDAPGRGCVEAVVVDHHLIGGVVVVAVDEADAIGVRDRLVRELPLVVPAVARREKTDRRPLWFVHDHRRHEVAARGPGAADAADFDQGVEDRPFRLHHPVEETVGRPIRRIPVRQPLQVDRGVGRRVLPRRMLQDVPKERAGQRRHAPYPPAEALIPILGDGLRDNVELVQNTVQLS